MYYDLIDSKIESGREIRINEWEYINEYVYVRSGGGR